MTTTATVHPAAWEPLETALRTRRPVLVAYHGHQRLICPHALAFHNGRAILLGYQTGGYTTNGTLPTDRTKRWRCMHIDQIDSVTPADTDSPWETADNYNPTRPFNHNATATIAVTP
jgi:hypothetical protein